MLKTLLAYMQSVITLAREVDRLTAEVKRLDEKTNNLSLGLQRLTDENKMLAQQEKSAREYMLLQLRLEMMEMERRLSSTKPPAGQK